MAHARPFIPLVNKTVAPAELHGSLEVGVGLGKYHLHERIAQGGMGEIYRGVLHGAWGFEKTVAVKKILPAYSDLPEFRSRFLDEARLVADFNHINIVQVFDFLIVNRTYYLVMEYLDGLDLAEIIHHGEEHQRPLSPAAAVFITIEVARGLAYAHSRTQNGRPLHIVHRDVSPPNILVSHSGEVKITDFGIAKVAAFHQQRRSHQPKGALFGKLRYMSPEQISFAPLDERSDIFSLGLVLYELLTLGPAIDTDCPEQFDEQIKRAQRQFSQIRRHGLPGEIDRIVGRTLARDRSQRYSKASHLLHDLTAVLHEIAPGFDRDDLAAELRGLKPKATVELPHQRENDGLHPGCRSDETVDLLAHRSRVPPVSPEKKPVIAFELTPPVRQRRRKRTPPRHPVA